MNIFPGFPGSVAATYYSISSNPWEGFSSLEIHTFVLAKMTTKKIHTCNPLHVLFMRNPAQGLLLKVLYFWASIGRILVLKILSNIGNNQRRKVESI